jgi:hypothetical protein
MSRCYAVWRSSWLAGVVVVGVATTLATAAPLQKRSKPGEFNPANATVEMFQGISAGDLEVKVIPKDSTECRVFIKNKTDKPLNVKLPEAFAAVPAVAQFGGGGGGGGAPRAGGGGGRSTGSSTGGNQSMGGGMGGMGMGGMGGGGGMFNVAPEKVGDLTVTTVCLEHGKGEPKPKIPYVIQPIESFTKKADVQELCRMLGEGRIDQRAAQVAAWHLSDGMSWEQLALKRLEFANGTSRPYFSPQEIQAGMQIATAAVNLAKERQKESSPTVPSRSDSLSVQ